ncbi:MAG TPA: tannase/feruloyl esterase family alpha/beta hydrolase [Candidatus Limnocylindria bacterium]|nr:tannase/feruloyl esterase family alpha/beta hydrolase [Candidatus Limnocylindria bacterium]
MHARWTLAALLPLVAAPAAARVTAAEHCAALAALALPGTEIEAASAIPASRTLPAYCKVRGTIERRVGAGGVEFGIGFELRLPDRWNRRFFFQGGAGSDGVIFPPIGYVQGLAGAMDTEASALSRRFAVVSTDAGHQGFDAGFGVDPQARIDYAYRAIDVVTRRAKEILAHYYGRLPKRSYIVGCSNGGRQAMIAAQRFPEHFDGAVAASPAFDLSRVMVGIAWDTIAFDAIAPSDGAGGRILAAALSDDDLALVAAGVLAACDELDGLADGIVAAPSACRFDPATLACPGAKTPSCLSAPQVAALARVFDGAHDSAGTPLYASWPWDPGIASLGWRSWKLGISPTAQPNALNIQVGFAMIRHLFLTPPDPAFDPLGFDFDTDPARLAEAGALIDATSTALDAFRRRHGKLLIYAGVADPVFSARDLVAYYDRLAEAQGGLRATRRFARLFLVPGMTHCSGGPAFDRFDALSVIVRWVEKGRAPARIVASGAAFPGRTRPLCAHPAEARYRGGDPRRAASFRCMRPAVAGE